MSIRTHRMDGYSAEVRESGLSDHIELVVRVPRRAVEASPLRIGAHNWVEITNHLAEEVARILGEPGVNDNGVVDATCVEDDVPALAPPQRALTR